MQAALHDTLIWFNLFSGHPWIPYGFSACVLLLAAGFIRRRADPPLAADLRESSRILANNRTRRSRSIVRKLLREGNLHWLPVYVFVMQSDLGREGIIKFWKLPLRRSYLPQSALRPPPFRPLD
jgi:hypothetical protein